MELEAAVAIGCMSTLINARWLAARGMLPHHKERTERTTEKSTALYRPRRAADVKARSACTIRLQRKTLIDEDVELTSVRSSTLGCRHCRRGGERGDEAGGCWLCQ